MNETQIDLQDMGALRFYEPEHNRRETNIEFLTRIMEFSPNGAMTQMFVMDAVIKQAQLVADADLSSWPENHIISGPAWQSTARNILTELKNKGYV